ncbi:hypothetical protein D3C72_1758740 [compost metagenome]
MRCLIHIHSANDHQIARVCDGRWHTIDIVFLGMELDVATCFHCGKQWGQILLRMGKIHFVQHDRVGALIVSIGFEQEIDKGRANIAFAIQRINVTQQAGRVMPAWLDRDGEQPLQRVGLPFVQRKRISSCQNRLAGATKPGEHSEVTTWMAPKSGVQACNQSNRERDIFGKTLLDGFQRGPLEWRRPTSGWYYTG